MKNLCIILFLLLTSVFAHTSDGHDKYKEYEELALAGDAHAQNELGVIYNDAINVPRDYKEAARWYKLAASQNYNPALCNLAKLYRYGDGVKNDFDEAFRLYKKAADNGFALGQFCVGDMYSLGEGVDQENVAEANRHFKLAADQGFPEALYMLGSLYENGVDVPQDFHEALRLLKLSADLIVGDRENDGFEALGDLLSSLEK